MIPSDAEVSPYGKVFRGVWDSHIDWDLLDVEVKQGSVNLYGEVMMEDQKGLATLIASTVPGVTELGNRILFAEALSKDARLRKAVWGTLRDVDALRDQTQTLKVLVKNAVATLAGSVEEPLQKEAAGKAVHSVQGMYTAWSLRSRCNQGPCRPSENDYARRVWS